MCSITNARQKSRSVAVRWVLIVRDRAWYHTIEQRLIDVMILGRFGLGSRSLNRQTVMCWRIGLVLFSLCKDGSDQLMRRVSCFFFFMSYLACSQISLALVASLVLAIHLAFFFHCDTHTQLNRNWPSSCWFSSPDNRCWACPHYQQCFPWTSANSADKTADIQWAEDSDGKVKWARNRINHQHSDDDLFSATEQACDKFKQDFDVVCIFDNFSVFAISTINFRKYCEGRNFRREFKFVAFVYLKKYLIDFNTKSSVPSAQRELSSASGSEISKVWN